MQCEKCGNEVKPPGGCRNGICYSCSLSTLESGFEESLWLVRMRLDMDANRIADEDEDEQDIEEKRYLLALRNVVRHVDSQAKRIAEFEKASAADKPDWRIGLKVAGKYRHTSFFEMTFTVLDVLPDGTYGIDDKNGVLVARSHMDGSVIVRPADQFVTA